MNIKTLLVRIPTIRFLYSAYKNAIDIRRLGGRSPLVTFLDEFYCNLFYGASPSDYKIFEFYRLKHHECNKFETIRRHNHILEHIQKTFADEGILEDKDFEYKKYAEYIHRSWMMVEKGTNIDEIKEFVKGFDWLLAKPVGTGCGYGIEKFHKDQENVISEIVSRLGRSKHENRYVIEECISNAPFLKELNPSSLNTFRVFTLSDKNGETRILEVMLRVGKPGMFVDNWSAGGVLYRVDIESGIVIQPGIDKDKNRYIYHPGTNIKMVGYQIPNYQLLKDTIENLVKVDRRVSIVGWDVTFTTNGIEFIEMNSPGGHDILQFWGTPYYETIKKALYD